MKGPRKRWWVGLGVAGALLAGIAWAGYVVYPIYACYLIPAEVTNRVYGVNLHILERHKASGPLDLDSHEIGEWKSSIESLPLVSGAEYVGGNAGKGTWRIRFERYESCLDPGDVLELTNELSDDGLPRVACRANFKNAEMAPFQCRI